MTNDSPDNDHATPTADDYDTAHGVELPAIDGCPECGSTRLLAEALSHESATLGLDGNGGLAHFEPDTHYDTYYYNVECECGHDIIVDGAVVSTPES